MQQEQRINQTEISLCLKIYVSLSTILFCYLQIIRIIQNANKQYLINIALGMKYPLCNYLPNKMEHKCKQYKR